MQYFTTEEYDRIVQEILHTSPVCYDSMLTVANRVLYPYIRHQCSTSNMLRGGQHEEDIMQLIRIRLIQTCVTGFFCRDDGTINTADGFKNWLFTVGKNVYLDFYRKMQRIYSNEEALPETEEQISAAREPDLDVLHTRLNAVFAVILDSRSSAYKILAWLALQILMLRHTDSQIEANHVLQDVFSPMKMDDMLDWVVVQMRAVEWMEISDGQIQRLREKMEEPYLDFQRLGDVPFGDLFRDLGTISDWTYKMNNKIRKEIPGWNT